jgi:uncharacterized protein (DUF433 family)
MRGAEFASMVDPRTREDIRYNPLYSLVEVGRYSRVKPDTLRSWIRSNTHMPLLFPAATKTVAPLSFINLIEAHVLLALRRAHTVPMRRIRTAIEWLKDTYAVEHPLAEIDLETDGRDVFVREFGLPVSASRKGQIGINEILSRYLQRIERDPNRVPVRFYPLTYDTSPKLIIMDPAVAYGRPVIKDTRITTLMIFERYSGGESLIDIADDYGLEMSAVEEALRCEIDQRAAA